MNENYDAIQVFRMKSVVVEAVRGRRLLVSALVQHDEAHRIARLLSGMRRRISVGLCVVLTDHPPLSPLAWSSGLLDPKGKLVPYISLVFRALTRRIDRRAVQSEIHAQRERFRQIWGRDPEFLTSFRGVHRLPTIAKAFSRHLDKYPLVIDESYAAQRFTSPLPTSYSVRGEGKCKNSQKGAFGQVLSFRR